VVAKNAAYYGRGGVNVFVSHQRPIQLLGSFEPGSIFDVAGSSLFPADPLLALAVLIPRWDAICLRRLIRR